MPRYDFQDVETGEQVLLEFSPYEICSWGERVEHEGRTYERVFSVPNLQPEFRPVTSMSQPRVHDQAERRAMVHEGRADGFDAEGRPQFHTAKTAKNYADATGGAVTWDK